MKRKFKIGLFGIICVGALVTILMIITQSKPNQPYVEQDFSSWIGKYTFYEFYEPNININYELTIEKEDNQYYGILNMDGFQTLVRAKLIIEGNSDKISLFLKDYLPGNINTLYNKGETLFSLENINGHINTEWGSITPTSLENNQSGETGFKKINN